jgi:hypothetical protein
MAETPNPGRRQVLQVLAGSVGAGLAAPALAGDHASHARPAVPPVAVSEAPAAPGFLDPHQLETLASLAEAIVPGSTVAGVAPFVDRLLAVDTRETQTEFLAALGAIQAESVARYRKPWLELTPQQQTELLDPRRTGPGAGTAAGPADASRPVRSVEAVDRDGLLQLGARDEGAGMDGPVDPPGLPGVRAPGRARVGRVAGPARLTAARVLHYRWSIPAKRAARPHLPVPSSPSR